MGDFFWGVKNRNTMFFMVYGPARFRLCGHFFCDLVILTLVDFILFSTGASHFPSAAVRSATGLCRALLIGSRPS